MPIWNLTFEKVEQLKRLLDKKEQEMKALRETSREDMWRQDIQQFLVVLDEVEAIEEAEMKKRLLAVAGKLNARGAGKSKPKKKKAKKQAALREEEDGDGFVVSDSEASQDDGEGGSDSDYGENGNARKKAKPKNAQKIEVEDHDIKINMVTGISSKINKRQFAPTPIPAPAKQSQKLASTQQTLDLEEGATQAQQFSQPNPKPAKEESKTDKAPEPDNPLKKYGITDSILKYLSPSYGSALSQTQNSSQALLKDTQTQKLSQGTESIYGLSLEERLRIRESQGKTTGETGARPPADATVCVRHMCLLVAAVVVAVVAAVVVVAVAVVIVVVVAPYLAHKISFFLIFFDCRGTR